MGECSQKAERERIVNIVVDLCSIRVRAGDLFIHEATRRVPYRDLCGPAQGNQAPAQRIVNQRSDGQVLGRFDDPEIEPRRSDGLQVFGTGEELEDLFDWFRKPLLASESVDRGHGGWILALSSYPSLSPHHSGLDVLGAKAHANDA